MAKQQLKVITLNHPISLSLDLYSKKKMHFPVKWFHTISHSKCD